MTWNVKKNKRRCDLIDKQLDGTLTTEESVELNQLQKEMCDYRHEKYPLPTKEIKEYLDRIVKRFTDSIKQ